MSIATLPAPRPGIEAGALTFGLPFSSEPMSDDLRRVLPPSTAEALDAIGRQMRASVFDPLLYASSQEELRERFGRLFRTYWLQYLSASLQLASAAAHEPSTIASAIMHHLGKWRAPAEASRVLGDDVTMMLSSAVNIIGRVLRRSIRTLMQSQRTIPEQRELKWLNGFVLCSMAVGAVLDALRETPLRGRRENAVLLAMWSREYALQLYAFSRELGWVPDAAPRVPAEGIQLATADDEEERLLAEAGLRDWAHSLGDHEPNGDANSR